MKDITCQWMIKIAQKTIRVKLELQDRGIVCIIKVLRRASKELYVV